MQELMYTRRVKAVRSYDGSRASGSEGREYFHLDLVFPGEPTQRCGHSQVPNTEHTQVPNMFGATPNMFKAPHLASINSTCSTYNIPC